MEHRPPYCQPRHRAFTLVELLVVVAIIALLIGILLPALGAVRAQAKRTAAIAQLERLSQATDSYITQNLGNAPGYVHGDFFDSSKSSNYQDWTQTENLLLSLMGQTVKTGGIQVANSTVRVKSDGAEVVIGDGPKTDAGRVYGAFFSPKSGELAVIEGVRGNDNEFPELVDPQNGLPVLCYRGNRSQTAPVGSNWASSVFTRTQVFNYVRADALKSINDIEYNNKDNSLIGADGAGSTTQAAENLAWFVINRELSKVSDGPNSANGDFVRGSYVFISAGDDGIYMNKAELSSGVDIKESDIQKFDDVVVAGGS